MSLVVNFTPEAWRQFEKHVSYLAVHASLKQAFRYVDALEATVGLLSEMPKLGAAIEVRRQELAGVRSWAVKRPFQEYQIYYRVEGRRLDVLHILHGAQDRDAIL